jgi:hypothetical protein
MVVKKVTIDAMLLIKAVSALSLVDNYIADRDCSPNAPNTANHKYVAAMIEQTLEDLLVAINKEGLDA